MTTEQNKITTEQIDISNYTKEQIEELLGKWSLRELLNKYKLTAHFCVKYILSTDDYAWGVEDSYYDRNDVLLYQEHLTNKDLDEAYDRL